MSPMNSTLNPPHNPPSPVRPCLASPEDMGEEEEGVPPPAPARVPVGGPGLPFPGGGGPPPPPRVGRPGHPRDHRHVSRRRRRRRRQLRNQARGSGPWRRHRKNLDPEVDSPPLCLWGHHKPGTYHLEKGCGGSVQAGGDHHPVLVTPHEDGVIPTVLPWVHPYPPYGWGTSTTLWKETGS